MMGAYVGLELRIVTKGLFLRVAKRIRDAVKGTATHSNIGGVDDLAVLHVQPRTKTKERKKTEDRACTCSASSKSKRAQ